MERSEIQRKVLEIIAVAFDVPANDIPVNLPYRPKHLSLEELILLEILLKVEDKFSISISDREAETLETVTHLVNMVIVHLKLKNAGKTNVELLK